MVRLVITDFASKDDNESFYLNDEFDISQQMFTYDSFIKHSVFMSKYEITDEIFSLNLLSKKHLSKNQFLVHIADDEYVILFNHKTVYSSKINKNFVTDDMIKSILITKHIAMLSSGGDIEKIYYVVNSENKSGIENILKQNTRNEKNEVVAKSLGDIGYLIKPLNELDNLKSHLFKGTFTTVFVLGISWIMFSGLGLLTEKIIDKEALNIAKREIKVEDRIIKRQNILLNRSLKESKALTQCITNKEVNNG